MLTSCIQRPRAPRLSPAALDAAATAFLADAEGVKCSTVRNRGWRSVIQQGPSWEKMSYLGTDPETFEDNGTDLGIVAASPWRDTAAPGNPARALDRDEWNAILSLYPSGLPDRDVLILSSQIEAKNAKKIGEQVGLSGRRVRQIQDRIAAWTRAHLDPAAIVAHLDDPLPTEKVKRRPPSRAGRKPKGGAPKKMPRFLVLVPREVEPPKPQRTYKPRKPRTWAATPGQLDMWEVAA